jgi:hypothetical protein
MPNHALDERSDLTASLRAAGPDAPTLCGEWTTNQLAAHLVLRERLLSELAVRVPIAREAVNLLEYLVHNEDVRRAGTEWEPRALAIDRQQAVWAKLRKGARLTMRSVSVPLRLEWPSRGAITVGRGGTRVTVTGDPVELALVAFGRQPVARVDYDGAPDDIAAVRGAKIAI